MFGGFPFGVGYFGDSPTTTGTIIVPPAAVATHSSGKIQRRKPPTELVLVMAAKAELNYFLGGSAKTSLVQPYTATTATSYQLGGRFKTSHPVINVASVRSRMRVQMCCGTSFCIAPPGLIVKPPSLLISELNTTIKSEDDLVALLVALDEL